MERMTHKSKSNRGENKMLSNWDLFSIVKDFFSVHDSLMDVDDVMKKIFEYYPETLDYSRKLRIEIRRYQKDFIF